MYKTVFKWYENIICRPVYLSHVGEFYRDIVYIFRSNKNGVTVVQKVNFIQNKQSRYLFYTWNEFPFLWGCNSDTGFSSISMLTYGEILPMFTYYIILLIKLYFYH